MKIVKVGSVMLLGIILFACNSGKQDASDALSQGPSRVEMRQVDGKYRLFVNDEEFFVKGAGCQFGPCYQIADHGGNAIRTWSTGSSHQSGLELLDQAQQHGLMVMMGISVASERHGFDYNDEEAVALQLERIREQVIAHKDHPALLGWGIGNELNLHYSNKRVWNAVDQIAQMIKEVDGNHVVTTMLAGIRRAEVEYIAEHCPHIDFLSIQLYGDIINLAKRLENAGYTGPYLVTEWGATGHWEVDQTAWGSPIEQTSSEKADAIMKRYKTSILGDEANCMGSFVFLWGQKQERTPSWYGLFTEDGEKTEPISAMQYLWTGTWPEDRAPRMIDLTIKDKGGRFDNVVLGQDRKYTLELKMEHHDMQGIKMRAEIMPEPRELSEGGDYEPRPQSIDGLIISASTSEIIFRSPAKSGAYRILVYATDNSNNAGTANIPFLVTDQ